MTSKLRVVVDATAVSGGGLATYANGLLTAWARDNPSDELVIATSGAGAATCELVPGSRQLALSGPRLADQQLRLPRIARACRADALLGLLPQLPFVPLPCASVVVAHDVRHEIRPWEFSRRQRALRRLAYSNAYKRAAGIVAISERTAADVRRLHPPISHKVRVCLSGADHLPSYSASRNGDRVLAFAHHTNKRPELAIAAVIAANNSLEEGEPPFLLDVVGADADMASKLTRSLPPSHASMVTVHPRLDPTRYDELRLRASVVLLASTFEGFCLPVLEAFRSGQRVVSTREPAIEEVGRDFVVFSSQDDANALADALLSARRSGIDWSAAQRHAGRYTWSKTANCVRAIVEQAVGGLDP